MTSPCQKNFADCRCERCTDLREEYDAVVQQDRPDSPRAANWHARIPRVHGSLVTAEDIADRDAPDRSARAQSLAKQTEGSHRRLMSGRKHGGALGLLMALRQGR